jgi:DeoR/GlpR family transcriptional regulator of sugar metabolism
MAESAGLTTPNLLEAEANQDFIASAARIAVLADHTKWNVRGLCRFARLDEVHVLVTDSGLSRDARTILAEHVEELVIAPVRPGKRADGTPDDHGRS